MTDPLIRTKLRVPRTGDDLVVRPRLNRWLGEVARHRLTLVCAPAGFGKTTLLAQWARASGMPVAWLTLDEADDDPGRFWRYFVAALGGPGGGTGADASALLMGGVRVEEAVLDLLINDLAEDAEDRALVLDDYHLILSEEIHRGLSYVVENLPDTFHLVVAGRKAPPWRLSRLRGRGQLAELGAADLRFARDEAEAFLTWKMRLGLSREEVEALTASTEGWVAGLQLAALSLRSRPDHREKPGGSPGVSRAVFDYLSEEVLRGQPDSIREFMMRTSVADRLTGPLCEALTGHEDGQEMLERLERANLFVFPVDEERTYYRYHRLFARFLRQRLRREHPEEVRELHLKAAGWYRRNDRPAEAVRHALQARDFETAADLLESAGEGMLERGEAATLLEWLEALPEEVADDSSVRLGLLRAWALTHAGRLEAVDTVLQRVEQDLRATNGSTDGDAAMVRTQKAVDKRMDIRGEVAAVRARVAAINEDARAVTELAREALLWLPRDSLRLRGNVALDMAHGHNLTGEARAADEAFAEAARASEAAGNLRSALLALWYRSSVKVVLGSLDEATELAERCLELAEREENREAPVSGMAHVAVAQVLYEREELDRSERSFEDGVRRAKRGGEVKIVVAGYIGLARLAMARGRSEYALELMRRARRLASWPHIGAWQARLQLAAGNLAAAGRWADEYEDPSGYPRDLERLTVARVLLARGQPDAALGLLERRLAQAEAQGRVGHVIEALLLAALARDELGETDEAASTALRAATLAEAGGFRRVFVDEGAAAGALLAKAIRHARRNKGKEAGDVSVRYLGEIVEAIRVGTAAPGDGDSQNALPASLTEREREVLRLVAAGLSNAQIADELYLALGTVKAHVHRIYGKLLVSSRTQAVERARALGLLG